METLVMQNNIKINNTKANTGFIKSSQITAHKNGYEVIHPLFDIPEEKIDTENAAPLHMTKSVKWSLVSLRAYLIIMIGLSIYRSMVLAGFVK